MTLQIPPHVPSELIPSDLPKDWQAECRTLWEDVIKELCDEPYLSRSHHNVGTYDQGCRGPLCRKAHREHPKRRKPNELPSRPDRPERAFDPVLEFYHTVAKLRLREYRSSIMMHLETAG